MNTYKVLMLIHTSTHTQTCLCTHKHTHTTHVHMPRHRSLIGHTHVSRVCSLSYTNTLIHTQCTDDHNIVHTHVLSHMHGGQTHVSTNMHQGCSFQNAFCFSVSGPSLPSLASLPFPGSGKLCGRRGAAASSWTSEQPEAWLPGGQPLGPVYTCERPGDPLHGRKGGPQA